VIVYHHEIEKGDTMFYPNLFHLFFGNSKSMVDTTRLVSAFMVGEDL